MDKVLMMIRSESGDWNLRVLDEPAQPGGVFVTDMQTRKPLVVPAGRHFMDILEPTLGNLIRTQIPGAPKRQKAAKALLLRLKPEGSFVGAGGFCHGKGIDGGAPATRMNAAWTEKPRETSSVNPGKAQSLAKSLPALDGM